MSNYSPIKFYVRIRSRNGNILDCLSFNCAFSISDVTQSIVFQFVENLLKKHFFGFLSFFLGKLSKSLSFKVEYLENGSADFDNFGLICKILNGLLDEINLFQRCSSPLNNHFEIPTDKNANKTINKVLPAQYCF